MAQPGYDSDGRLRVIHDARAQVIRAKKAVAHAQIALARARKVMSDAAMRAERTTPLLSALKKRSILRNQ